MTWRDYRLLAKAYNRVVGGGIGLKVIFPLLDVSLPPTAATFDFIFDWYLFFGTAAAVVVIGLMVYLALRYRARDGDDPHSDHRPEGWKVAAITALISISILSAAEYQTFAGFSNISIPQTSNAVHISVLAFQWGWNFTYPNGSYSIDNLTVPAGVTVILNVTSRDVFHSFGIPMLGVKSDAIPGRVNSLWFEVNQPGVYKDAIRCFELCGVGHAFMIANLTVVSQSAWNTWVSRR
jgi:cytochrome c oxidase subunit 2